MRLPGALPLPQWGLFDQEKAVYMQAVCAGTEVFLSGKGVFMMVQLVKKGIYEVLKSLKGQHQEVYRRRSAK